MSPLPSLDELASRLEQALARPLPGEAAHRLMAPRVDGFPTPRPAPPGARRAAALLVLYPRNRDPHVLLTVRSSELRSHRGQVSLPGGMLERNESPREAALREAREEVALPGGEARILGDLTPLYIPGSGFLLQPVVAVCSRTVEWTADPGEVDRVLEVPVTRLADPSVRKTEPRTLLERNAVVPFFDIEGVKIWGATAMILAEFLELIETG